MEICIAEKARVDIAIVEAIRDSIENEEIKRRCNSVIRQIKDRVLVSKATYN